MARYMSSPEVLPKQVDGLVTNLASSMAIHPDRNCAQMYTCESSNTEHTIHTA